MELIFRMNLLQHWQRKINFYCNRIMGNCFTCLKSDASEGQCTKNDTNTEPSSTVTTARSAGTCLPGITIPELADKSGELCGKCIWHKFWCLSLTETAELLTHRPSIAGNCDNQTGSLKKSVLLMLNTNVPDTMPINGKRYIYMVMTIFSLKNFKINTFSLHQSIDSVIWNLLKIYYLQYFNLFVIL